MWHQLIWPNFVRPWILDRGLKLSANDASAIAAQIESLRGNGPVTANIVSDVWRADIQEPIIHALERI
jgi:hypothetical protein